jgi:hypothetical protein
VADMNELIRAFAPPSSVETPITIETYRTLSPLSRRHEWRNLTDADQAVALREGIQPEHVEPIGGKSDGGAHDETEAGQKTDMSERLREAWRATHIQ